MDPLLRLRDGPEYDNPADVEHLAVLDAADLLDALRPEGYDFTVGEGGALRARPPAGRTKTAGRG